MRERYPLEEGKLLGQLTPGDMARVGTAVRAMRF
jgi:hypothetical protein